MNLMELQHSKVPGAGLVQPEDNSELSLRISELRREYAKNSYTKTEEQKGLAIILHRHSKRHFSRLRDPGIPYIQEFFEEMGFVVKGMVDCDLSQLYKYMADEKFYCVFIVLTYEDYEHIDILNHLLFARAQGKPTIVMSDHWAYGLKKLAEQPDTLLLSPWIPFTGRYQILEGVNIFDDFMKVTRSNRFSDIMDILTRMNALHDRPVITFQSTFRKKLYFL
ncbi:unnamed protein product [Mytilus coruscus]|uniref:Uncharacterized protein n=1 Tax=Mytilus coruscus TaxID=42192 RepID=A0A6J8CV63_MYTCO|nr:unnamed protein product [Mytilus coruscus]